jgi:hypothetical protein
MAPPSTGLLVSPHLRLGVRYTYARLAHTGRLGACVGEEVPLTERTCCLDRASGRRRLTSAGGSGPGTDRDATRKRRM